MSAAAPRNLTPALARTKLAPPLAALQPHCGTGPLPGRLPAVRVGLSRVFGLARSTADRIAGERARRPWASLADLIERASPTLPELEALILAGAMDATGRTRPSLLLEARVAAAAGDSGMHGGLRGRPRERANRLAARASRAAARAGAPMLTAPGGGAVMPDPVTPLDIAALPEFDVAERVRGECRSTGLWFSAHPLEVWIGPGAPCGTAAAAELARHVGRRVELTGLPCARRRVETKTGGVMLFLSIADRSGVAECVLFPEALRRFAGALDGEVLRVAGRVDDALGAVTLDVTQLEAVATAGRPVFA